MYEYDEKDIEPILLGDGKTFGREFDIIVDDSKVEFTPLIDAFTVRLHNVSCPNAGKGAIGVGNLEAFIWQKDGRGNFTKRVRIVPTGGEMKDGLPPYWVALPGEEYGTFVIAVIDDGNVKKLLLPRGKLSFRWNGYFIMNMAGQKISNEKPQFKAKSLELHVVCKIPKESEMGQLWQCWYCWNCGTMVNFEARYCDRCGADTE